MDFDKDFYQKWKAKSTNNRRLFLEDTELSGLEADKVISSTAIEEQQAESQFSLHLSESFVDETQESLEAESEPSPKEVVLISDSSSDESALPPSSTSELPRRPAVSARTRRPARLVESSDEEQQQQPVVTRLLLHPALANLADDGGSTARQVAVEDSEPEDSEPGAMQQILKETVAESATLSERKKKEILNWLSSNFENMSCVGSSYSQDSVVSGSRKSATCSSGNSSLERLEMNFETPNNRGKVTKVLLADNGTSSSAAEKDTQRQSRLDKFFNKSKMGQLSIVRDRTPGSRTSDKTPTNVSKPNPRRILRNVTPASTGSDRTPTNKVRSFREIIDNDKTPTNKSFDKTPTNTKSNVRKNVKDHKILRGKISDTTSNSTKTNPEKTASESQLSELVEDSEDMPVQTIKKNIIIPESESFESKESSDIFEKLSIERNKENLNTLEKLNNNNKNNGKSLSALQYSSDSSGKSDKSCDNRNFREQAKVVPENFEITDDIDTLDTSRESVENQIYQFPRANEVTKNNNSVNIFKKVSDLNYKNKFITNKQLQKASECVPDNLEITDDIDHSDKSSEQDDRQQNQQQLNQTSGHNITNNTTINDCADILENLYGESWRNQARALISATEPKKQTKKFFRDVQTEKKFTFKKPQFNLGSDNESLGKGKENDCNVKSKVKERKTKRNVNNKKPKDSFINDDSTTESSPDCSFYTAVSNPRPPSQNNLPTNKTASTTKINDKNNKNTVLVICDSESDEVDDENWKIRNPSQRKLSFDSSSSSITSEFDPDDIVPVKTKVKTVKPKKLVNHEASKTRTFDNASKTRTFENQFAKKSFVASLSKDVPAHQADFKAMTYRNKYNVLKEELAKVLFKLFNEKVFENKLPEDLPMEWSVRLRGTAGQCYNKQSIKALGKTVRSCKIALAAKVLDSPERLRDTLIHEMCHAATWLINNVSDGHGRFWKAWAHKAMKVFPELPPITRCHDYEIQTKYTYKCTSCGYSVGRHSKSLNLNTKRCGYCYGKFELLINKVTKDGKVQKKSTAQSREPTGFALFVKENYHLVKKSGAITKHGEVMKVLGQQFSAIKLTPKPGDRRRNNEDESP